MPINLTEKEFARLGTDRTGQKPPLRVKPGSAWHRKARRLAEGPREATAIEQLAARGYTRRVDGRTGLIWFEDRDGHATPRCATLDAAVAAAMGEAG